MKPDLNWPIIRLLMIKDWQLFQKQLAAYLLAGIVSLGFLGMAKPWAFYIGSLLLIIILVAIACFAISTSLLTERKEQTLAFVMSLPVSPLDFTVAKLAGNLLTFSVPFLVMALFTAIIVYSTPLPDGLIVLAALIFGHVLVAYCIALTVAMQVESEGWNTFVMIGSMVLINPFIMAIGQMDSVQTVVRSNVVIWHAPVLAILAAQTLIGLACLAFATWSNGRKPAFC